MSWPTQRLFRILAALLVMVTVSGFVPAALDLIPTITPNQAWGGLFLIGMGLLHLSFSSQSLRVSQSLLTLMAGFEIYYAVVEASTLVTALLAIVNLGIAMAGAYLVITPSLEEVEA